MTTKECITDAALTLFSERGYTGTSVKNIADAVGIRDASLYKHFKSKQEIFDSIVELINAHISGISAELGLPQSPDGAADAGFYTGLGRGELKALSEKIFLFYLTDPYISRFWRLAHMEQYRNERIYEMFHSIFMDAALDYQTRLFAALQGSGVFRGTDARAAAVNFYAPIFLLLTMYHGREAQYGEALAMLDAQIDEFYTLYRV